MPRHVLISRRARKYSVRDGMGARVSIVLLALFWLSVGHAVRAQEMPQLSVAYTGRLLGYMRGVNPDEEQCIDGKANIDITELDVDGRKIPCSLDELRKRGAIIVGMGDNLAPAYWSRFKLHTELRPSPEIDPGGTPNFVEQYRIHHTTEPRLDDRGRFADDPVALFLQRACYDALVPGKEDFYFGAYHLMMVARQLKSSSGLNCQADRPHLLFLGANLFLKHDADKLRERSELSDPKHFVLKRPGITAKFDGDATPWLVSLKFDLDPSKVQVPSEAELCRLVSGKIERPCIEKWPSWIKKKTKEGITWSRYEKPAAALGLKDQGSTSIQFVRSIRQGNTAVTGFSAKDFIQPGDYLFCFNATPVPVSKRGAGDKPEETPFCQRLTVEEPMFCAGGDCSLRTQAHDRVFQPYTMVDRKGSTAAIFGVVDENLESYLARDNTSWEPQDRKDCKNVGKNCRTSMHVLPPEEALQQALEFFELKETSTFPYKLLLAQMAQPVADELGSHVVDPLSDEDSAVRCITRADCSKPMRGSISRKLLAFQIVVAKGDGTHFTPKMVSRVEEGMHRSMVVSPRQIWDADAKKTIDSVSIVTLRLDDPRSGWATLENQPLADDAPTGDSIDPACAISATQNTPTFAPSDARSIVCTALAHFNETWNHKPGGKFDDVADVFPQFVLHALVDYEEMADSARKWRATSVSATVSKADVALLQQRDFFYDTTFQTSADQDIQPHSVQEVIDRILWKDDFLSERSLTGAQIKALLKQSEKFESEEQDASAILPDTTGRYLVKAGMLLIKGSQGEEDKSYVEDDDFVDATVYKVATSNHIAGGETGYPDAAKDAIGNLEQSRYTPISAIICHAIEYWAGTGAGGADAFQCRSLKPNSGDYRVSKSSDDILYADSGPFKGPLDEVEKNLSKGLHDTEDPYSGPGEKRLEQYPILDVNADKTSAGYQLSAADTSQANLKNFSGITNSDFSQPSSSNLNLDQHLRVLYRFRAPFDIGLEDTLSYTRQRQDSLSAPTTTSWPKDTFTVGPVLQLRGKFPWLARNCKAANASDENCNKYLPTYNDKFWPHFYYVAHPFDFTVQPSETTISLSGANSSSSLIHQERAYSFSEKLGFREEWAKDTYIETGFQWQSNRRALSELTYPGAASPCDLSSSQSLSSCFSSVNLTGLAIQTTYRKFLQQGLYWDGKLTLPFTKNFSYALDTNGALFANRPITRSNSALARYYVVVGNSLKIPLIGNFSLQPRFELVFYQNQILENSLFRRNFMMNLNYSFERNSRVPLWKMMQYDSSSGSSDAGSE